MAEDRETDRLQALEARITKARLAQAPRPHTAEHYSLAHLAWRMVIELVAGLLIGFGIGYGLDTLLGTLPVFMVLFTGLGFAAGVQTMVRSAREIQEKQAARKAEAERD